MVYLWTYFIVYFMIEVILPVVLILHLSRISYFTKAEPRIDVFYVSTPTIQPRQRPLEFTKEENGNKNNVIVLFKRKEEEITIEMPNVII